MTTRSDELAPRIGGASMILAAVLFVAVFWFLATTFGYPDVLERPAAEVLPRLVALGDTGRAVWVLYGLIPLLLVPAGVGVEAAFGRSAPGAARAASCFAMLAAICMMLGLLRWPSIQWELGRVWATAAEPERAGIATLFAGLNAYLGNFIGEFVGELCLNLFFALTAWAMLASPERPRWMGLAGLTVSLLGTLSMFRNVTPVVALVAEINNLVLPVWLVVQGVILLRSHRSVGTV